MLVLLMPYAGSTGVVYKERVCTRRHQKGPKREPEETNCDKHQLLFHLRHLSIVPLSDLV